VRGHRPTGTRPGQAIALHEVRFGVDQRPDQALEVSRMHLSVRSDDHGHIEPKCVHARAPRSDGRTYPAVHHMLNELDVATASAHCVDRPIYAPIIDDDDMIDFGRDTGERPAHERGLVVCRHDRRERTTTEHEIAELSSRPERVKPCAPSARGVTASAMADVLFVSKPVGPPWNDSSKNLVRDVAGHLRRYRPIIMGRGDESPGPGVTVANVYGPDRAAAFSPQLRQNLAVLRYLSWSANADIWHFFFAPNPRSSTAGKWASRLRRVRTVHTVCSLPRGNASMKHLVFADITVALSRFAEERLLGSGISADRVRRVPPCVPALSPPSPSARDGLRRKHGLPTSPAVWIYPGDLELGNGARLTLEAFAASKHSDAILLMACRDKTRNASHARRIAFERAARLGISHRVHWLGETLDIHGLLALSDCVVLPSQSSFGKMDYPLVALEAMSLGRPVVVSQGTPAAELAHRGAALATDPRPDSLAAAIDALIDDDEERMKLGDRGRALVSDELSPARTARAYERIYEELHV